MFHRGEFLQRCLHSNQRLLIAIETQQRQVPDGIPPVGFREPSNCPQSITERAKVVDDVA